MAKERPSYKKLHLLVPLQERTVMALRLATATNLAMPAQKWNQELASQLIILPVAVVEVLIKCQKNGQIIIHYGTFVLINCTLWVQNYHINSQI